MFRPASRLSATEVPEIKIPERQRAVLVVSCYYPAHSGNSEVTAGQLIEEISAHDNFHFTWAASHTDNAPVIDGQVMLPMRSFNILEKIFGLRWPLWSPRSLRQLRSAMEKADLVWLHDNFSHGSIAAFSMARRLKKPVLITQQTGSLAHKNAFKRLWHAGFEKLFTRKIFQHARQTTFASDGLADYYYRRTAFNAPVTIIPNGVDLRTFHPALPEKRKQLRSRFSLRDDQPVLLFAGNFGPDALEVIRNMARLMPDWRFWLAGQGRINPDKWFMQNVQCFRGRSNEAMAELYQAADFLILPECSPSFPRAAQEAMACGLPVMCSPEIATGSRFATDYLWTCKVVPGNPRRTAKIWSEKLKGARSIVPMKTANTELTDLAQSFWEDSKIAEYYADILRSLCKPGPQKASRA